MFAISRMVERFEGEFTLHDKQTPQRRQNEMHPDNIDAVKDSVVWNANVSEKRYPWRILRKDLGLHLTRLYYLH